MKRKAILNHISDLIQKKGIPKDAVLEDVTVADGRTAKQLRNHHKMLMRIYKEMPDNILKKEYDILKYEVEGKPQLQRNKELADANGKSDSSGN